MKKNNSSFFVISEFVDANRNSTGYYWNKIIKGLSIEIENLKASETSLGGSNKQRRDSYSQTLAQLSDTLAVITEGFIPASAMPVALEQILKSSKNLSLLSLENKPVELISGAGPDQNAYLYRHGVQMKMRGSYVASMAYLKKLE